MFGNLMANCDIFNAFCSINSICKEEGWLTKKVGNIVHVVKHGS